MAERYGIKAIQNTLVGEGLRTGSRAVQVVFSGCNLWDGRPLHRSAGPGVCAAWCDADFARGTPMDADAILATMAAVWPADNGLQRWCWLTGGEPLLQVNLALLGALKVAGWRVALETNGTLALPAGAGGLVDHLCVSPKLGTKLALAKADELKVVLPGAFGAAGWTDAQLEALETAGGWGALYVQPQDVGLVESIPDVTVLRGNSDDAETQALGAQLYAAHVRRAVGFVMAHPHWRLSAQTQKPLALP